MATSVLIEFDAKFPKTEFERIYNADFLATQLNQYLEENGITVPFNDLWIDAGWCLECKVGSDKFMIMFAKYTDNELWEMTIEPIDQPGIIKRIFGKKTKPYIANLQKLSSLTIDYMKSSENISKIKIHLSNDVNNPVANTNELKWNNA